MRINMFICETLKKRVIKLAARAICLHFLRLYLVYKTFCVQLRLFDFENAETKVIVIMMLLTECDD